MTLRIETGADEGYSDAVSEALVAHNHAASELMRRRFEPEHLRSVPVEAYALDHDELVGGCVARMVPLWQWLEVDVMWVAPDRRRGGVARGLLDAVEAQARLAGCRWSKLNTWDFQAPHFYAACGYVEYGREVDYPPGHINLLMRKEL